MAIRYDQKTKDEVVAFITKYNEENGRGGQSAAAAKWKLNPITVKAWMEKAGVSSPGKSSKKKKKAGKPAAAPKVSRAAKAAPKAATGSISSSLKRMVEIQEQIQSLQSEYESLKATL
ncbi:MAG: hypothetical protein P1U68_07975 [Verrucomicrobiales bacterium]|nr:hypothetical protein [Verrucomicrobiales bacterium]